MEDKTLLIEQLAVYLGTLRHDYRNAHKYSLVFQREKRVMKKIKNVENLLVELGAYSRYKKTNFKALKYYRR